MGPCAWGHDSLSKAWSTLPFPWYCFGKIGGNLGFKASTNLAVSASDTITPTTHIKKLPLLLAIAIDREFTMEPTPSMIQPPWKTIFLIAMFLMIPPFHSPFSSLWCKNRRYMKFVKGMSLESVVEVIECLVQSWVCIDGCYEEESHLKGEGITQKTTITTLLPIFTKHSSYKHQVSWYIITLTTSIVNSIISRVCVSISRM